MFNVGNPIVVLEVDGIVPVSVNRWAQCHWSEKAENKQLWESLLWATVAKDKIKKIQGEVYVEIIFVFKNKLRDYDNFVIKGLMDGLKETLLTDDSSKYVKGIFLTGEISKEEIKTIIKIYQA